MNVFIYVLADPRTSEIRYVGKAVDVRKRFLSHLWEEKRTDRKTNWIKSLKRLGLTPEIEVIEIFQDSNDEDWQEGERFWISYLRFLGCRLTNLETGGYGGKKTSPETIAKRIAKTTGQKRSAESRAKMRIAKLGKKASAETRLKMSLAQKGIPKPKSATARANMSAAHRGKKRKPLSAETKAKIGAANRGRIKTPETIEKCRLTKIGNKNRLGGFKFLHQLN